MTGDLSEKLNSILQNPAMMSQIKALADTMTAEEGAKSEPLSTQEAPHEEKAIAPDAFPMANLISPAFEQNIKNTCALLQALRPFLDVRRREKIDKVLQMMHLAEMAGKFGSLL